MNKQTETTVELNQDLNQIRELLNFEIVLIGGGDVAATSR